MHINNYDKHFLISPGEGCGFMLMTVYQDDQGVAINIDFSRFENCTAKGDLEIIKASSAKVGWQAGDVENWRYFLFGHYVPGMTALKKYKIQTGELMEFEKEFFVRYEISKEQYQMVQGLTFADAVNKLNVHYQNSRT